MKILSKIVIICLIYGLSNIPALATNINTLIYLQETEYINSNAPEIQDVVSMLTKDAKTNTEKAIRIHDYVRDEIKFGWTKQHYKMKATDVLKAKVGWCCTKTTLFVAMLRAAGIPARQHFATLKSDILKPLILPPSDYMNHAYSEVYLDGNWIALDSYTVDTVLFNFAKKELKKNNKNIGFGIHINGKYKWDGKSNCFSQFVNDNTEKQLTTKEFGVYRDALSFYKGGKRKDELKPPRSLFFPLVVKIINKRLTWFRGEKVVGMKIINKIFPVPFVPLVIPLIFPLGLLIVLIIIIRKLVLKLFNEKL